MKILKTSSYVTGSGLGQPFKSGSSEHIQTAYRELFDVLGRITHNISVDSSYSTSTPYSVFGTIHTTTTISTITIPDSWIYYNGDFYFAPGTTLFYPPASGSGYVGTITDFYITDATHDPTLLSDGFTSDNVHLEQKIVWGYSTLGSGTFNLGDVIPYRNIIINLDDIIADRVAASGILGGSSDNIDVTIANDITSINSTLTTIGSDRSAAAVILGGTAAVIDTTIANDITTINNELSLGSWITLPLTGSWTPGIAGNRVRKDGMGRVQCGGTVDIAGSSTTIGTLPVGYRPTQICIFSCPRYDSTGPTYTQTSVQVNTDGTIVLLDPSAITGSPSISLDPIHFLNS